MGGAVARWIGGGGADPSSRKWSSAQILWVCTILMSSMASS